ncbi:MAG: hypothetical protein DRN04_13130 [Thermoprotei archaeon]|nr:MAG: hypothetical protein DRN04_13130 [Thermoprotei archaeon]
MAGLSIPRSLTPIDASKSVLQFKGKHKGDISTRLTKGIIIEIFLASTVSAINPEANINASTILEIE